MERTLNAPASSCSSSALILPKTMSACLSEADSNTGLKLRQGPHHGAQKSRMTRSFPAILSKLSLVTSTVAMPASVQSQDDIVAREREFLFERTDLRVRLARSLVFRRKFERLDGAIDLAVELPQGLAVPGGGSGRCREVAEALLLSH